MILIAIIIIFIILYFWEEPVENFVTNYEINGKPIIWSYWDNLDGNKTPPIIELCIQTLLNKCSKDFNIILLNSDNINKYIDLSGINLNDLSIAHKVDIYRTMLLYKYGGLYLDADIVCLKSLTPIIDKLKEYDFVGFGCSEEIANKKACYGKPSNWCLASRKGTKLFKTIINKQLDIINKNKSLLKSDYHAIGKKVIWDSIKGHKYFHYMDVDGSRDINGEWITTTDLFSNKKIEYKNPNDMLFCVYYNSHKEVIDTNKLTKEEIMNSNWTITKFINQGLTK